MQSKNEPGCNECDGEAKAFQQPMGEPVSRMPEVFVRPYNGDENGIPILRMKYVYNSPTMLDSEAKGQSDDWVAARNNHDDTLETSLSAERVAGGTASRHLPSAATHMVPAESEVSTPVRQTAPWFGDYTSRIARQNDDQSVANPWAHAGTQRQFPQPAAFDLSFGLEPSDMTPEQEKAWNQMLHEMRKAEAERKQEEAERERRDAAAREFLRALEEAKVKLAERLARRTPEEKAYDDALKRRTKAERRSSEDWRDCLDRAKTRYNACVKQAELDWMNCRDEAAQLMLAWAAGCLFTGPGYKACIASGVVAWGAQKILCDQNYDRDRNRCQGDYESEVKECHEDHVKDWKRIQEDHPVPPKPESHDYQPVD